MDGLTIQIPPKKDNSPDRKSEPPPRFVVEDLVADGAVLRILPRNLEKEPLQFDLHQLRVRSRGSGRADEVPKKRARASTPTS